MATFVLIADYAAMLSGGSSLPRYLALRADAAGEDDIAQLALAFVRMGVPDHPLLAALARRFSHLAGGAVDRPAPLRVALVAIAFSLPRYLALRADAAGEDDIAQLALAFVRMGVPDHPLLAALARRFSHLAGGAVDRPAPLRVALVAIAFSQAGHVDYGLFRVLAASLRRTTRREWASSVSTRAVAEPVSIADVLTGFADLLIRDARLCEHLLTLGTARAPQPNTAEHDGRREEKYVIIQHIQHE